MAGSKKSGATSTKSSKGLGRGLGNLIPETTEEENVVVKEVVKEVVVKEPAEMKLRLSQIQNMLQMPVTSIG